jgi:hypothetical protein
MLTPAATIDACGAFVPGDQIALKWLGKTLAVCVRPAALHARPQPSHQLF